MTDKSVFRTDPLIGCPFDDSDMVVVDRSGDLWVGRVVEFDKDGVQQGTITAIGENAKYLDGKSFTAVMVKVGEWTHLVHSDQLRMVTAPDAIL